MGKEAFLPPHVAWTRFPLATGARVSSLTLQRALRAVPRRVSRTGQRGWGVVLEPQERREGGGPDTGTPGLTPDMSTSCSHSAFPAGPCVTPPGSPVAEGSAGRGASRVTCSYAWSPEERKFLAWSPGELPCRAPFPDCSGSHGLKLEAVCRETGKRMNPALGGAAKKT